MLNLPVSIKRLFNSDRTRKNFRVRFPNGELPDITNENIVQESVRFTESICSQDVLKFGLTESSVIEFETVGIGNMYGVMIECFCEVDTSSLAGFEISAIRPSSWGKNLVDEDNSDLGYPFFRVPYGVFRVESCPRNQDSMMHRKVTAYSLSYSRLSRNFADLPQIAAWPEFIVDPMAFYDQLDESKLIETEVDLSKKISASARQSLIFNRAGNRYDLRSPYSYQWLYEIVDCDFVKVEIQYDAAAYEAEGMKVVKALEDAGYNFSYTAAGKPLYKSHEEAMRDRYPELFEPVLYVEGEWTYKYTDGSSTEYPTFGPLWHQPLRNGELTIVSGYEKIPTESSYKYAFTGTIDNNKIVRILPSIHYVDQAPSFLLYSHQTQDFILRIEVNYPPVEIKYIKKYSRPKPSGIRVKVKNTADAQHCIVGINTTATRVFRYSYVDAYNREKMLDGYLELNAMFGKVNRQGKVEGLRLSTENPVAISASDYSQFWWDEFDVEPIGSVIFSYTENEKQQTVAYNFGAGLSVYDMTDNAVINSLDNPTRENIEDLIQQNFVPHLLPIAFTPIDLDMKGLPYLEDGDYLAVTAADGTVAHSFNMRHELGGIQVLEANVTSVSGQIMDSEVE